MTRKDVAEKAGVSPAVVSRVINDSGYVAEEKRKRVLKIVKELGYNPHPVAVSLKKNRTKQILYYVVDLKNYYYMEMYRGMVEYAASKGYVFIIAGYMESRQIGSLMVDGILLPSEDVASNEFLQEVKVPMAIAGYDMPYSLDILRINVKVSQAVHIAYDHLNDLGHRKIAYASMDTSNDRDPRQNAFLRCALDKGVVNPSSLILGPSKVEKTMGEMNFYEAGTLAANQFLERSLDVSAILCFNDDIAIGMLSVLNEQGISIPDELSIIGIDGHFGGIYTTPALTTVSLKPDLHGRECARALINLIEGNPQDNVPEIVPHLVIRKSTRANAEK
ncbi:MAG: LacI family DNA-binding transcriptional regulator [Oceanispirochaeta sp.]|nr:LacI family DNA-binding transcriptional regulator [Oceanispirochaeta sp.]MDA3958707.1 LacI family DNA-binding transcriptional regulator [Oceanispirochaeta sp.]